MPVIDHGAQFLAQLQQNQVNNEAFQRQVLDQMQQMQRQMLQMQGQMRDVQAQMQTMQRDMNAGFDGLSIRMDSIDRNGTARHFNAAITHVDTPLHPLVNASNEAVPNFPDTLRELSNLQSNALTELLRALGQAGGGTVGDKRRRLKHYIGVVIDLS
ncbi:hypothetical protein MMC16_000190 [Acarospora aff. strigata]|nr:hypothetical protein [Acarospora aff. strigata]